MEILYSIITIHSFFLIFLSTGPVAWSGARNLLAPEANALLKLCPSFLVTFPWISASMALMKPEPLLISLPGTWSLQEQNPTFLCSMVKNSVKVVRRSRLWSVPTYSLLLHSTFCYCISVWSWKSPTALLFPHLNFYFICSFVSCKWDSLPTNI